jgi:DNA-binding transcriptional MerR regulator
MPTAKRKHAKAQAEVVIPEKIYFRIGEVSELADLPTYVLRFWETEFSQLKPIKSSTGQRMYRRRDVEYVMQIRKLLYEDGFTIAGARDRLREEMQSHRLGNQSADPIPDQEPNEAPPSVALEAPSEAPSNEASSLEALPAASQATTAQVALPFLTPVNTQDGSKEALRRLRQQLCEVRDLLS